MAPPPSCPHCGAAHPPGSAPGVAHTCRHCGRHYRLGKSTATPQARVNKSAAPIAWLIAGLAVLLVVAIAAGAGLVLRGGTGSGKPASASANVVAAPVTARFELHTKRPASRTSLYLLGLVTNTSAVPIGRPEIVVNVTNSGGRTIDTRSGRATREALAPGESCGAKILIARLAPGDQLATEVVAKPYAGPLPSTHFEITPGKPHPGRLDRWVFPGRVRHTGALPARSVFVELLAFDEQEKLVAVEVTAPRPAALQPGESAPFQAYSPLRRAPARTEYHAWDGRP